MFVSFTYFSWILRCTRALNLNGQLNKFESSIQQIAILMATKMNGVHSSQSNEKSFHFGIFVHKKNCLSIKFITSPTFSDLKKEKTRTTACCFYSMANMKCSFSIINFFQNKSVQNQIPQPSHQIPKRWLKTPFTTTRIKCQSLHVPCHFFLFSTYNIFCFILLSQLVILLLPISFIGCWNEFSLCIHQLHC